MSAKFAFIIGTGRCGTSWLGQMLNSHTDVCVPPETQVLFEYSGNGNRLFEEFSMLGGAAMDRERLSGIIEKACPHNLDAFFDYREFCRKKNTPDRNIEEFAPRFYSEIAKFHGKSWLIEQTPWYGQRIDLLVKLFPKAKFVHMVRDGRDVALSFSRTNWWTKYQQVNLERWKREIKKICFDAGYFIDDKKYIEVRYEDLVFKTEAEVRKICEFLGVRFQEEMLNPERFIDYDQFCKFDAREVWSRGYSDWRSKKNTAAFSNSVGGWRKFRDLFQAPWPEEISQWLLRFGYDLEEITPAKVDAAESIPERRADIATQRGVGRSETLSGAGKRIRGLDGAGVGSQSDSGGEKSTHRQGAEVKNKERVLVFPGFLRLMNDLGVVDFDSRREPANLAVIKKLVVPILKRNLKINERDVIRFYPRIKDYFESGDIINISNYIVNEGYFDGVIPSWIEFDEEYYLEKYEDVRLSVLSRETTPIDHWLSWGYREGRYPCSSVTYISADKFLR